MVSRITTKGKAFPRIETRDDRSDVDDPFEGLNSDDEDIDFAEFGEQEQQ